MLDLARPNSAPNGQCPTTPPGSVGQFEPFCDTQRNTQRDMQQSDRTELAPLDLAAGSQCPMTPPGSVGQFEPFCDTQRDTQRDMQQSRQTELAPPNLATGSQCPMTPPGSVGQFEPFCDTDDAAEENLTCLQLQAMDLMIQGYPDIRISEMLPVSRRTLWRWKTQNDDFRRRLIDMRRQTRARVADRYHDMLSRAWKVFEESLDNYSDKTRLSAAQSLLHMAAVFKQVDISSEGPDMPKIQPEPVKEAKAG